MNPSESADECWPKITVANGTPTTQVNILQVHVLTRNVTIEFPSRPVEYREARPPGIRPETRDAVAAVGHAAPAPVLNDGDLSISLTFIIVLLMGIASVISLLTMPATHLTII